MAQMDVKIAAVVWKTNKRTETNSVKSAIRETDKIVGLAFPPPGCW